MRLSQFLGSSGIKFHVWFLRKGKSEIVQVSVGVSLNGRHYGFDHVGLYLYPLG